MDIVRKSTSDPDDERRDEVLRQMLKTPPTRHENLKLGKPRNPRQKPKDKKKPGQ